MKFFSKQQVFGANLGNRQQKFPSLMSANYNFWEYIFQALTRQIGFQFLQHLIEQEEHVIETRSMLNTLKVGGRAALKVKGG